MIQLLPLLLLVLLGTACGGGPEPVRTGGPPETVVDSAEPLDEEERKQLMVDAWESLRVYDVEEVSAAIDRALAGTKPTEEALAEAIEAYLTERREALYSEIIQRDGLTEEELSEGLGESVDERLFPVILAMEKKRLGLE